MNEGYIDYVVVRVNRRVKRLWRHLARLHNSSLKKFVFEAVKNLSESEDFYMSFRWWVYANDTEERLRCQEETARKSIDRRGTIRLKVPTHYRLIWDEQAESCGADLSDFVNFAVWTFCSSYSLMESLAERQFQHIKGRIAERSIPFSLLKSLPEEAPNEDELEDKEEGEVIWPF